MQNEKKTCNNNEEIDFSTFVYSLGTTTLISLGVIPDPDSKELKTDLISAKQNIDILEIILLKTKGNLSPEEDKTLKAIIKETKSKYCEAAKRSQIKL